MISPSLKCCQGTQLLYFKPNLIIFVHLESSSLFIYGLYGKMELCRRGVHRSRFLNTRDQLFHHIKLLKEFVEKRNRKFHNKFSFYHHKSLPIQNHIAYRHPKIIVLVYVRHDNILRFNITMSNFWLMHVFQSRCNLLNFRSNFCFRKNLRFL